MGNSFIWCPLYYNQLLVWYNSWIKSREVCNKEAIILPGNSIAIDTFNHDVSRSTVIVCKKYNIHLQTCEHYYFLQRYVTCKIIATRNVLIFGH